MRSVKNAAGRVASGFAGPLAEALEPGAYKVVVEAGDQQLTDRVNVTLGVDVVLKVVQRGDRFQLLHEAIVGVVDRRQLEDLGEAINNFEFEPALVKLQEIAQLCQRNGQ